MPNKFGDAVRDTVAKARKTRDKYVQAARDLSRVPGTATDVVGLKGSSDAFDKAAEIRRKGAKKSY